MGALDMGLQEEELEPLVKSWREANPNIVDQDGFSPISLYKNKEYSENTLTCAYLCSIICSSKINIRNGYSI